MSKSLGFLFFKIGHLGQIWPRFGPDLDQIWPRFGPDLAKVWPRFSPNYVHLTHFVTGLGSSNLIYALTVVITFRSLLGVEASGFYFIDWLFGPDLAQTSPKFGPI